jgi:hypothetical protein
VKREREKCINAVLKFYYYNYFVHICYCVLVQSVGNESLHEISNDNGIRVVNFATSKNLTVKSTMFPHRNIHKLVDFEGF